MESEDDFDDDEDMDTVDIEQRKRARPGRPPNPWNKKSRDSKNQATDEIMDEIRNLATKLGCSVTDLALFFGKRDADQNGDRALSDLFEQLNRLKADSEPKISPLKALALKKSIVISRNKYQQMINMLGTHNVFPSKNMVKKYEDSIKVKLTPFMGGYKADLKDVITQTIQRILLSINYTGDSKKLTVKLTAGFDGSGSHVQRAGRMSNINTKVIPIP